MTKPRFTVPKSRRLEAAGQPDGLAPLVRTTIGSLSAEFAKIAEDANLSDIGRKHRQTEAVKLPLFNLNERRQALRAQRRELEAKAAKAREARAPMAATESERREVLALWEKAERLDERGNHEQATHLRRVLETENPDPQTYRLQVALLSLHPALVGPIGAQMQRMLTVKLGLNEERDDTLVALSDEAERLAEEEAQIMDVRSQLIASADRTVLEKSGILPKKPTTWTSEERAQFIQKHGADEYRSLLHDEMREALGMRPSFDATAFEPEPAPKPAESADDPSTTFLPAA